MQTIKTESVNWVMTRKTMHMSWQLGVEGMIIDDYDNDYEEDEKIRMKCSSATFQHLVISEMAKDYIIYIHKLAHICMSICICE